MNRKISHVYRVIKEKQPIIGLLPEIEAPNYDWEGTRWVFPQCNLDALNNAGAKPFLLQYDLNRIPEYVRRLNGLLLPGNVFNIADYKNLAKSAKERLVFEMTLVTAMFKAGKPVFGICGGMQAVGKLLGGKMVADICAQIGNSSHNYEEYREVAHIVDITPGSFMYDAADNKTSIGTNGIHNQGFVELPDIFKVAARTKDRVIEAVSLHDSNGKIIFFGTQFHPEINHTTGVVRPNTRITETDQMDRNLLQQFVDRAKEKPQPQHTVELVAAIKRINAIQEVLDAPTKPDLDPAVVMPSAGNNNKCGAQRKSVLGDSNLSSVGKKILQQALLGHRSSQNFDVFS